MSVGYFSSCRARMEEQAVECFGDQIQNNFSIIVFL